MTHNYKPVALIQEAARHLGCDPLKIEWYSWPQQFGSTAGPHGGIGGQMATTFQVFGFVDPISGKGVMECAGKWAHWRKTDERCWDRGRGRW